MNHLSLTCTNIIKKNRNPLEHNLGIVPRIEYTVNKMSLHHHWTVKSVMLPFLHRDEGVWLLFWRLKPLQPGTENISRLTNDKNEKVDSYVPAIKFKG